MTGFVAQRAWRLVSGRSAVTIGALGVSVAALSLLPLLHVAPNRLTLGEPINAARVLGHAVWPLAGLLIGASMLSFGSTSHVGRAAAAACILAALLLLFATLGSTASDLSEGHPIATRVRLASGSFTAALAILLAGSWSLRACNAPWRLALSSLFAALLTVIVLWGELDALSLVREFRARKEELVAALLQHVALAGIALALALATVTTLYLPRRARWLVEPAVAGIQVVPAVALFGALVALTATTLAALPALRALGFAALGTTPALIGIAAYLLLPLWRGLEQALHVADRSTIDAAEALGLSPMQLLTRVRLPLGRSVLIDALRVSAVQSIGLATLGALVGAGGLGRIIFDGMAQFAADLILVGAIPILLLSLAVDRALGWLRHRLRFDPAE